MTVLAVLALTLASTATELPAHMQLLASTAEQGDADAQYLIGQLLLDETVDPHDPQRARYWLKLAADQSHAYATEALGNIYYLAQGVTRDLDEALIWYRRAAELGLASAQNATGLLYLESSTPDCGAALGWLEKALAAGEESARNNLAWALATCADAAYRDGRRALRLAREHVYEAGYKSAGTLDTLAAAYAEAGDFVTAVQVQREALGMAHESLMDEFSARLALYEGRQAYRQPNVP